MSMYSGSAAHRTCNHNEGALPGGTVGLLLTDCADLTDCAVFLIEARQWARCSQIVQAQQASPVLGKEIMRVQFLQSASGADKAVIKVVSSSLEGTWVGKISSLKSY
eukprot:1158665-Pelagomonas_calceolata.AAC.9